MTPERMSSGVSPEPSSARHTSSERVGRPEGVLPSRDTYSVTGPVTASFTFSVAFLLWGVLMSQSMT